MRRSFYLACLIFTTLTTIAQDQTKLSNEIRLHVESATTTQLGFGSAIYCRQTVFQFYFNNLFESIWNNDMASELIQVVSNCGNEGLNPSDYHLDALETLFAKSDKTAVESAEFELLLTDSFILLASHMISGKVDPQRIDTNWKAVRREGDPVEIFKKALESGDIVGSLYALRPRYKGYARLMDKLALHRRIAEQGGWDEVPEGITLKLDIEDDRVVVIKKRLRSTGDLKNETEEDSRVYDIKLQEAVTSFQRRHGLADDGNIGKVTLEALNIPIEGRIIDIMINLERCRWLPQDLGEHHVMVNIPAFVMEVIKGNELMLEMDVAVGKPFRETPVFSAKMIYLVFNPYWTVPPTILAQDIIPAQSKNPNYLKNLNIRVLNNKGVEVSPAEIDWNTANLKNFPYQLRQDPGPNNALGEVKFIFPNPFNVYMHDTNHRELFVKSDRALSSGCIRLSKPLDLASYLLASQQDWSETRLREILKSQQNYTIPLVNPLNVHLQYWTSFIDENGVHNFRKDIYNRNDKVYKALMEAPRVLN